MKPVIKNKLLQFGYNLALSVDQFVNVILLGDPDESISGRLGRAMASGRPKWWVVPFAYFVDGLFLIFFWEKKSRTKCYRTGRTST